MTDIQRLRVLLSLRGHAEEKLGELKPLLIIGPSAIIISVLIIHYPPFPIGVLMSILSVAMFILFVLGAVCILGVIKVSSEYFVIRRDLRRLTENIIDEEISRAEKEEISEAKSAEEANYISIKRKLSALGLDLPMFKKD